MELHAAILTLFLVMDPVGNVPVFLSYLKEVAPERRPWVIARESCIALAILLAFLLFGQALMETLRVGIASLHISGGVLLFLISLGMIFPGASPLSGASKEVPANEPFIVPLAMPLLAGPSIFATLMIMTGRQPERRWEWLIALVVAWSLSTVILVLAGRLSQWLGRRGLEALERLMGMILIVIAVQMFLDGVDAFLVHRLPGG